MNMDYVAGFFDGEVCFTIAICQGKRNRRLVISPRITITQSDASNNVLETIVAFLNMGRIYYHTRSRVTKTGYIIKEVTLRIHRIAELRKLTELLKNRLIVKKHQLELFTESLELIRNRRRNIRRLYEISNELCPRRKNTRKWTMARLEDVLKLYQK